MFERRHHMVRTAGAVYRSGQLFGGRIAPLPKRPRSLGRGQSRVSLSTLIGSMASLFWESKQRASLDKKRHPSERNLNDEDSCQDSWVELTAPSRGSLCSSLDALVLLESDNTNFVNKSHQSPKSLQSPHVEFENNLEQVKYKLARDMLPPGRNTDWIWDWSSRPEAVPPKGLRFRPSGGSALTTPPNSPAPLSDVSGSLNLRHSKLIQSAFFRVEVLFGLVVSNLITFVLGAAIGFCVCKRLYDKTDQL